MKKVLLFLVCLAVSALGAAELVVAERDRPAVYSVVSRPVLVAKPDLASRCIRR